MKPVLQKYGAKIANLQRHSFSDVMGKLPGRLAFTRQSRDTKVCPLLTQNFFFKKLHFLSDDVFISFFFQSKYTGGCASPPLNQSGVASCLNIAIPEPATSWRQPRMAFYYLGIPFSIIKQEFFSICNVTCWVKDNFWFAKNFFNNGRFDISGAFGMVNFSSRPLGITCINKISFCASSRFKKKPQFREIVLLWWKRSFFRPFI